MVAGAYLNETAPSPPASAALSAQSLSASFASALATIGGGIVAQAGTGGVPRRVARLGADQASSAALAIVRTHGKPR